MVKKQTKQVRNSNNNTRALTSQRTVGRNRSTQQPNLLALVNRVKGRKRVGVVAVNNTYPQPFYMDRLGYNNMQRLAHLLDMYEKRLVIKFRFIYTPIVSKTNSGTVHMSYDFDPEDPIPVHSGSPATAAGVMAAQMLYKAFPVSEEHDLVVNNSIIPQTGGERIRGPLFNSPLGEARLSSMGQLSVMVEGTDLSSGDPVGHIDMEYEMMLLVPQISKYSFTEQPTFDRLKILNATAINTVPTTIAALTPTNALLQLQTSSSVAQNMNASSVYTATLRVPSGCVLRYKGSQLSYLSRIFFQSKHHDEDVGDTNVSSYIGRMALTKNMTEDSLIDFPGSVNNYIGINDVIEMLW